MEAAALGILAVLLGAPAVSQGAAEDDCGVIAAVAAERWGFNDSDRPPPPLWLTGYDDRSPVCDRPGLGVAFTALPAELRQHDTRSDRQYLMFARPTYASGVARIEVYYRRARYSASLPEICEAVRVDDAWRLRSCRFAPVS